MTDSQTTTDFALAPGERPPQLLVGLDWTECTIESALEGEELPLQLYAAGWHVSPSEFRRRRRLGRARAWADAKTPCLIDDAVLALSAGALHHSANG